MTNLPLKSPNMWLKLLPDICSLSLKIASQSLTTSELSGAEQIIGYKKRQGEQGAGFPPLPAKRPCFRCHLHARNQRRHFPVRLGISAARPAGFPAGRHRCRLPQLRHVPRHRAATHGGGRSHRFLFPVPV